MKNTFKRIAVIAMAVLMCVSAVVPSFAAGNACPGEGKTHTAYNCTYQEVSKQEATCDVAGSVTGKCKTCGTIFSVSHTDALGHDWDVATQAVCGYASAKTCKRCEKVETVGAVLEHLYTAWTLAEGECGVVGARITRECVWCKDVQAEKLGKEGHVFALVSYVEPAKCIDKGVATYECTVAGCDAVKEVAVEVNLDTDGDGVADRTDAHSWKAWDTTKAKDPNAKKATCDAKGRASMVCEYCDKVVVVATDKEVCDVDVVDAKPATCTDAGNKKYWECPDCDKIYSDEALTTVKTKAWTVVPAIHDGLTTSKDAIDNVYPPTCDTDGLLIYSCKVDGCDKADSVSIDKYTSHVYYNDVKDVKTMRNILVALGYAAKNWSDTEVQNKWTALGVVKVDGEGKDKVWKGYTAKDCENNAKVTYICLNFTYNYKTEAYVFSPCAVATETVLTGEGYDKTGHKFADTYPLSYSQVDDKGTPDDTTDDVKLAGTKAYTWEGDPASCKVVGRRVNSCINEHKDATGKVVACPKTETVGVAALGHDYVAYDESKIVDDADYTLKTGTVKGSALKTTVAADKVTCVEDGKAYTVCTRCNDVQYTDVTSAGTEHDWKYMDSQGNPAGTVYENNAVKTLGNGTMAEAYGNANCVTAVKGYYRQCKTTGCKAALTMEAVELPAVGHKYADTTDKTVLESILANTYTYATLVEAGSCENGATYTLKCENAGCVFPKTFEVTEGFGGGHVKTYLPNTAVAATCTSAGASNKWYCANEACDYYGYINHDGALTLKGTKTVDDLKSNDETGKNHEIWNAKKEAYETVDYKDVPDTKISGAASLADAQKVEAPVVDGKAVRYVAIDGTSLVWVYKYEAKDHTEIDVTTGGFYCGECVYAGADKAVYTDDSEHTTAFVDDDKISPDASCEQAGYDFYQCTKTGCFYAEIKNLTPAKDHEFYFVVEDADGKDDADGSAYDVNAKKFVDDYKGTDIAKTEGLNYVGATCTNAGYAIDNCKTCDKTLTISIKATGHINVDGEVLDSSCLDVAFPRDCNVCGVKNVPYGHDWDENAICKVCNAAK